MNPTITTLIPPAVSHHIEGILSERGFACTLLTLAPGSESTHQRTVKGEEVLLFGLSGETTVSFDELNIMLEREKALLLPQGRSFTLHADSHEESRLLHVVIPPRHVEEPKIVTLRA